MNKYGVEDIVRDPSCLVGLRVRISTLNEHTFLSVSLCSPATREVSRIVEMCVIQAPRTCMSACAPHLGLQTTGRPVAS
jgi:hypothetical protein